MTALLPDLSDPDPDREPRATATRPLTMAGAANLALHPRSDASDLEQRVFGANG